MDIKICNRCGKELPIIEFYKNKANKDGYYTHCKKCHCKYTQEWKESHKEIVIENNKKYNKKYKAENKEETVIYGKKYREENREKVHKLNNNWCKNNRDKCNINDHKYRAEKRNLSCTLTIEQWQSVKLYFNNSCAYCGEKLPLAQEHFISVNKHGEYTINNIIPACKFCNSSKKDRDFFTWYPKQLYYSKIRETIILKYLNYKNDSQQLKFI